MSKKVYISGNTANCFNEFTLCCTKDFDNKFLTNNSSVVDNEEYFYADFESVENIESYYENRIIKLQDEVTYLQHRLEVTERAFELACEPRDDWGDRKYSGTVFDNYHDYFIFIAEVEKELKGK